jgi:DNA-binding SARP family transcriptional activator
MNVDRLQLLDSFELRCDGRHVPLPMSAQRLLAFLAVHPRPLRRGHVAGVLWIDSREERAFASLRSALWRLQQGGRTLVDPRGGVLALHPGLRVDLHDASGLARALLNSPPTPREPGLSWDVLKGELLPDWDDDWVAVEREHQRHLSLQAMEALANDMLLAGNPMQALEIGLAVFSREPLRESAHRLLVRVHMATGNSFEAIRQYRMYERMTLSRLGLPPSAQMHELVRGLLPGDVLAPGAAA